MMQIAGKRNSLHKNLSNFKQTLNLRTFGLSVVGIVATAFFVGGVGCKKKIDTQKTTDETAHHETEAGTLKSVEKGPEQKEPPAVKSSLIKTIRTKPEMSGDVAIMYGKTGLWAVSIDGKAKHKIYGSPVSWAVIDNKLRVLWMVRPKEKKLTLELIDLEGPGKPETVLASFPRVLLNIRHDNTNLTSGDMNYPLMLSLVFKDGTVKTETSEGNYEFIEEVDELKKETKGIVISNMDRLKALMAKSKDRTVQPKIPETQPAKKLDVDKDRCESADLCGDAENVPGTHFWKVLIEHSCGDGCYTKTALYDPKSKKFFCAAEPKKRADYPKDDWSAMGSAWVAPSGKAYNKGYQLYSFETGLVTEIEPIDIGSEPSWRTGGGWLKGGWLAKE